MLALAVSMPSLLSAIDRDSVQARRDPPFAGYDRSPAVARAVARQRFADKDFRGAATAAATALSGAPLDGLALRTLAMAEQAMGHDDRAAALVVDGSFLSWRDPYIQLSLYDEAAIVGDAEQAAIRADALSRIEAFQQEGFAELTQVLGMTGGVRAVAARLAEKPVWRGIYFAYLQPRTGADPATIAVLLRALGEARSDATPAETDLMLRRMVATGDAGIAWAYWAQSRRIPPDRILDDGDFAAAMPDLRAGQRTSPFVWSSPTDTSVRIMGRRDPDGLAALAIEQGPERAAAFVARIAAVGAGRYTLSYQARGAAEMIARLHPELACANPAPVTVTPTGEARTGAYTRVTTAIDVPARCAAIRIGFTLEQSDLFEPMPLYLRQVTLTRTP